MPAHEHINWDQHYGKAFKVVQTPAGAASDKHGTPVNASPGTTSMVTPENEDAWNWPAATDEQVANIKQHWDTHQQDPNSQYKMEQIRRSM